MKTYIKRNEKNDELVMLYGGWGTDENFFVPFCCDNFDFILFYNYSADDPLVLPETKTYRKITLIAWSLGVWAAEYLLSKTGIVPDTTIAVNGTPVPVDDRLGIPLKTFEGTLNNITDANMDKFYFRMFGDKKTYLENKERIPQRTVKSLHDELRWLYNRMMEHMDPGFRWDYAVISASDRVFPAESMETYWKKQPSTRLIVVDLPHYMFPNWNSYSEFIKFVEKKKKRAKKL
jgi:pimeloyl-[acyl-carrier protein] methyl ester esterase